RRSAERDPKYIVPVYRRAAKRNAGFSFIAESRWCSLGFCRRTKSARSVGTADGKAANWTVCRILRHRGISKVSGHSLGHRDRPAVGCAGASRRGTATRAASLLVESSTLFERKGARDILHVLPRTAKSQLAGSRVDRLSRAPRADCD